MGRREFVYKRKRVQLTKGELGRIIKRMGASDWRLLRQICWDYQPATDLEVFLSKVII